MREYLTDRRWEIGTRRKDEFLAGDMVCDVAKDQALKGQTGERAGRDHYPDPGGRKTRCRDEIGGSLDRRKRGASSLRNALDDVDEAIRFSRSDLAPPQASPCVGEGVPIQPGDTT